MKTTVETNCGKPLTGENNLGKQLGKTTGESNMGKPPGKTTGQNNWRRKLPGKNIGVNN